MRCHLLRVAIAVGAISVLSWTLWDKEPHAMAAQVVKSWSDVRTSTAWDETTVDLLVPATSGKTSTIERTRARAITFRSSIPPGTFSVLVVPDRHTGKTSVFPGVTSVLPGATSVLPGGRFFISDAPGMTAVWLTLDLLNIKRSPLEVPTVANGYESAIAALVGRFTEKQVAEEQDRYSLVRLGESAPGFFSNGSLPVWADLKAFELADGVLRLDLRSQNGQTGSFWVELTSLRVVKTQVSR
jgi:hypothetical protein